MTSTDLPIAPPAAPWPAEALGEGRLGLAWTRERQTFHGDGILYVHDGPTKTAPSHDLAHLLLAANGGMPWCPVGERHQIRMAEYNAVLLESLLFKLHHHIARDALPIPTILTETLGHMRWFVDHHFAPFPIPAEEAYRRFCWSVDPAVLARLAPIFFELREREMKEPGCQDRGIRLAFERGDAPAAHGEAKRFADGVGALLSSIGR